MAGVEDASAPATRADLWSAVSRRPAGSSGPFVHRTAQRICENVGSVLCAAISEDGRLIALGTDTDSPNDLRGKGYLRVLPAEPPSPVSPGEGWAVESAHEGARVTCVRFLGRNGRQLLSGGGDGFLRTWDTALRAPLPGAIPAGAPVLAIDVSRDGRKLAAALEGAPAGVWSLVTLKRLCSLAGLESHPTFVALSPCGAHVAAAGGDGGAVLVADAATGRPLWSARLEGGPAGPLCFTPDGARVLCGVGGTDCGVHAFEARDGRPCGPPRAGHFDAVTCLAVSSDGTAVLSGSADGTLKLWDERAGAAAGAGAGAALAELAGHAGPVACAALSSDGRWAVSGSRDGTARLWRAPGAGAEPEEEPRGEAGGSEEARGRLVAAALAAARGWEAAERRAAAAEAEAAALAAELARVRALLREARGEPAGPGPGAGPATASNPAHAHALSPAAPALSPAPSSTLAADAAPLPPSPLGRPEPPPPPPPDLTPSPAPAPVSAVTHAVSVPAGAPHAPVYAVGLFAPHPARAAGLRPVDPFAPRSGSPLPPPFPATQAPPHAAPAPASYPAGVQHHGRHHSQPAAAAPPSYPRQSAHPHAPPGPAHDPFGGPRGQPPHYIPDPFAPLPAEQQPAPLSDPAPRLEPPPVSRGDPFRPGSPSPPPAQAAPAPPPREAPAPALPEPKRRRGSSAAAQRAAPEPSGSLPPFPELPFFLGGRAAPAGPSQSPGPPPPAGAGPGAPASVSSPSPGAGAGAPASPNGAAGAPGSPGSQSPAAFLPPAPAALFRGHPDA